MLRRPLRLAACGLLLIVMLSGVFSLTLADIETDVQISTDNVVKIKIGFEVNTTTTVNSSILVDVFDLLDEIITNGSGAFTDAVYEKLNSSLASESLILGNFSLVLNQSLKTVYLEYEVVGACQKAVFTQSNATLQFNPLTFLFEFVSRNTTLVQNNTFVCDLDWLAQGPEGSLSYNFTRSDFNFTYAFNLEQIFYYEAFNLFTIQEWNHTGNLFSAYFNYTNGGDQQYLIAALKVSDDARGVYALSNSIYFHIPVLLSTPYLLYFGVGGMLLIVIGSVLYLIFTRTAESQRQPIKEKWMDRRRPQRKT